MSTSYDGACILGAAESDVGIFPERTSIDLHLQAILRATAMAGIAPSEIDGISVAKGGDIKPRDMPSLDLAQILGIEPRYVDNTLVGGASPVIQIARAAQAITSGLCKFALVSYASTQASQLTRKKVHDGGWPGSAVERSTGFKGVISVHALIAARHMYEYGTTESDFASVAVAARSWARLNPAALCRDPLTIEDVLDSPIVSAPLHILDCCLVTDGGGAVVLGPSNAAHLGRKVFVRGFAEHHSPPSIVYRSSILESLAGDTAARALAQAAVRHSDIDVLEIYDAFTDMPIVLLENMGFAKAGNASSMIRDGSTMPGGTLPMNTAGGGLSHCHPGMYGIFLVIEAVRQLRGDAGERQVPNTNLTFCHAVGGGGFGSHASLVLEGESGTKHPSSNSR